MKSRKVRKLSYLVELFVLFALIFSFSVGAESATYKWRAGTLVPEFVPFGSGMYEFARLIEERTDGQIEIACFPSQQLGPWMDQFDNVSKGSLEIGFLPPSTRYAKLAPLYLEFVVTSWDDFYKFFNKEGFLYKHTEEACEELGIKLLGYLNAGFDGYSGMKGPVVYPEDITRLKIKTRVGYPTSKIYFEELGPVVSVDMNEVFTALQLGIIDCQANQAVETVYTQFRDVTKYFTDINSAPAYGCIFINKKLWDSLSPELQKIIQDTADEVAEKINQQCQADEEGYYKKFAEEGVVVTRLTPEQRQVWIDRARRPGGLWDQARDIYGSEFVDFLLENLGVR